MGFMDIRLYIIIAISVAYGCFEFFLGRSQSSKGSIVKSGDRLSVWIIIISISIGYWLSFLIGATKTGRIYHWNIFFASGIILIIIGLIIRVTSIMTLKRQFTYTVTKIENHQLIEKGLYNTIRHPGYLGQLIIFTGIATTLSNWLSILCMIVPVLLGYIYRMHVEEKFLIEQMGQKYLDYQKRTKRLIPMIY
jgi:protein-S-isoprenylcysteine O-methyltransferase Ste14